MTPLQHLNMSIQNQVIEDIKEREKKGIETYGTTLKPYNGRNALTDLYEELLDASMYLKQYMNESGGLLVDSHIHTLCQNGLVSPYFSGHVNPSSLDICIGLTAMIETENGLISHDFSQYTTENPYLLKPNEFILVGTLESFDFPSNICADIKIKSSRAREGLSHALAGWVDCGFCGVLTLELKNYTCYQNIPIYPGLRVAQLVLFKTDTPDTDYSQGRYSRHKTVIASLDKPNF